MAFKALENEIGWIEDLEDINGTRVVGTADEAYSPANRMGKDIWNNTLENKASIDSNDVELANHEGRITTLENLPQPLVHVKDAVGQGTATTGVYQNVSGDASSMFTNGAIAPIFTITPVNALLSDDSVTCFIKYTLTFTVIHEQGANPIENVINSKYSYRAWSYQASGSNESGGETHTILAGEGTSTVINDNTTLNGFTYQLNAKIQEFAGASVVKTVKAKLNIEESYCTYYRGGQLYEDTLVIT